MVTVCFLIPKKPGVPDLGLAVAEVLCVCVLHGPSVVARLSSTVTSAEEEGALGGSVARLEGRSHMAVPGAQSCKEAGSVVRMEKKVGLEQQLATVLTMGMCENC